jgi:hypothetical protein
MQTTQQVYMTADDDSGTDTDTSSDDGTEVINTTFDINGPEHIVQEQIYWQMRNAKRLWRRYTHKPVRKVRRFVRKNKGKGKGGKRANSFLAEPEMQSYLKGKGKGGHSSGKGFGRKKNPTGKDGNRMLCNTCGSDEHFQAKCPRRGSSASSSAQAPAPTFHALAITEQPTEWTPFGQPTYTSFVDGDQQFSYMNIEQADWGENPPTVVDPWNPNGEPQHPLHLPSNTRYTNPSASREPTTSDGTIEFPSRKICKCLCGCRRRPGRLVSCAMCESDVGPGCCLAYEEDDAA